MANGMATFEPLVGVGEIARRYAVHEKTVWGWVRRGILPRPDKIGGTCRWPRDVLDPASLRKPAAAAASAIGA